MVYMSNQEISINTGRYAPSVSYRQDVRAPIPDNISSTRVNDKTDWSGTIGQIAGMFGKGIEAYQKNKLKALEDAAEQQKQTALNNLAQQFSTVAEEQRQGLINASEADTRMRAISMDAITQGLAEEDVYNVGKRHGYGLQSLEEEKHKVLQKADIEAREKHIDSLIANNPGFSSMPRATVRNIIDQKNYEIDMASKYLTEASKFPAGSEDRARAEKNAQIAFQNNTTMNIANYVANAVSSGNTDINPEMYQAIYDNGVKHGVSLGLTHDEASMSVELVMERMGLKGSMSRFVNSRKLLTEDKQAALEEIMSNEKLRQASIPGVAIIKAIGGQSAEQALVNTFANQNPDTMISMANNVFNMTRDANGNLVAVDMLNEKQIPTMMSGVNNAYSSPHSDYIRGAIGTTAVELFLKSNTAKPGMSQEDLKNVILNTDGTRGYININLLKNTANTLENSQDAEEQAVGRQMKKDITKMEANEVTATMLLDNFTHRVSLRDLTEGAFKDQLRVSEDGEIFIRAPGVQYDENKSPLELIAEVMYGGNKYTMADLSTALAGSQGQVVDNLKKLNTYLSRLDPEVRREAVLGLGIKAQTANDEPYEFFQESIFSAAGKAVKKVFAPLTTPIAQQKGRMADEEMAEIDAAVASGNIIEGKQANPDIAALEEAKAKGLKPHIERAVDKTIQAVRASATTKSSETLANAKLTTDDLSIWEDVEAASAADTKASQGLSEYDTELGASGEAHYQEWKKSLPEQLQSDTDYDLRGYYKDTNGGEAEGHLTDVYKKPNHPTFSKESKYYKKGMWAGEWTEDGDFKIPLTTPKAKLKELIEYWRSGAEPTANLIVDNPKAEKEIDKLENRLAKYVEQLNSKHESADTKRLVRKEVNKLRQQISNLYRLIYVNTAGE